MNKNLHKVIFNRNTGLMAVVAEDSRNNGKASGSDSGLAISLFGKISDNDCIKISATNALKVAYALQNLAHSGSLKNNNGTKTLISAREIDLAIDELNNSAIIQTQGNNLITANTIKNNDGGNVSGSVVVLHARDELNNDGGSVRGKNAVGLYSDKDISLQTTTYSTENKIGKSEFSRTGIANVSQVTVENPDGIIDIQAKNDVNLKAANLQSSGSLNVIADGKINSDTVTVSERNFSYGNEQYFFDEAKSQEIGTNAQAAGNINFVSKNDGNYRAVNINSENGKTQIVSTDGKITVEEGRATNHIETRTHSQTSSLLSSKTEDRHYLSQAR